MRNHPNKIPYAFRALRRASPVICATVLAFAAFGPAHAITISQGEYDAGVVVVEGETQQPNQKVTMDDRFTEWSDNVGRFGFRVRYLPDDCMVQLTAGREVRPVYLANCALGDRPAEQSGAKAASEPSSPAMTTAVSNLPPGPVHLRIVRQPCERNNECRVVCREKEVAINAFCPDGNSRLLSERSVTCGTASTNSIVAYCLTTAVTADTKR